jgi:hypothetical protein
MVVDVSDVNVDRWNEQTRYRLGRSYLVALGVAGGNEPNNSLSSLVSTLNEPRSTPDVHHLTLKGPTSNKQLHTLQPL